MSRWIQSPYFRIRIQTDRSLWDFHKGIDHVFTRKERQKENAFPWNLLGEATSFIPMPLPVSQVNSGSLCCLFPWLQSFLDLEPPKNPGRFMVWVSPPPEGVSFAGVDAPA
ncbi:hypothetical protein AB9K41_05035, partial [Cribrihabitans sp. XS_ASV171]